MGNDSASQGKGLLDEHKTITGDLWTVDLGRVDDALDACDFLLEHLLPDGRYEVAERWGPESELYLSAVCRTLLEGYRVAGNRRYVEGAVTILDRLERTQMDCGGWSLKLGPSGMEFRVTEEERERTYRLEHLPMIGSVTYAAAKYQRLTGDRRYRDIIDRALNHLVKLWDPEQGCFLERGDEHFTEMRSTPAGYQVFFLLGLAAWRFRQGNLERRRRRIVSRLVGYLRRSFESFDEYTMPHMRMVHMALLMQHVPLSYVRDEMKPRIDGLIESSVFRCPSIVGGYGHRDSYRGIATTEANIRGSGAVALSMKLYDLTTGTRTYRDSPAYRDVSGWIDSMKANRGYFEYQTVEDGERRGRGSPAQYIPCHWIFGTF